MGYIINGSGSGVAATITSYSEGVTVLSPELTDRETTTERLGDQRTYIASLERKWSKLVPGFDGLEARLPAWEAAALLLVLEHSLHAFDAEGGRRETFFKLVVPWIRRTVLSPGARHFFQVHPLCRPTDLVRHRNARYPVAVKSRRCARVSRTYLEDLRVFHGDAAVDDFVEGVAETLARQIWRSQLEAVMAVAPHTVGSRRDSLESVLFQALSAVQSCRAPSERVPYASYFAVMHSSQLRRLSSAFDSLPYTESVVARGDIKLADGLCATVYEDPNMAPDCVLAGWRNGPEDAGAVWTPHTLMCVDAVPDVTDMMSLTMNVVLQDNFKIFDPAFFMQIRVV